MANISIIMNCFNGERYLREAIDSVYAQTFEDWEIIFIDNSSTDESANIAKSYDKKLRYYHLPNTIPLYAARNIGLRYITSPFVAFLDVDDCWEPNKLAKQMAIMKKYPAVYLVCSGYYRLNAKKNKRTRNVFARLNFISFTHALKSYPVYLSSVMLRYDEQSKSRIKFEASLNLTGDYELFVKLIHQYMAYYIAEPLVTLRLHENNLSAKLIHDWPKEVKQTHDRLIYELSPSAKEKKLMDKRYYKNFSLVHLAKGDLKKARDMVRKYILSDPKFLAIYFASFNKKFAKWLLNKRGF